MAKSKARRLLAVRLGRPPPAGRAERQALIRRGATSLARAVQKAVSSCRNEDRVHSLLAVRAKVPVRAASE